MTNFNKIPTIPSLVVFLFLSQFFSCKTPTTLTDTRLRDLSAMRLYKNAEENTFDYERFSIKKINIQFDNGESRSSFRASIQAIKDSLMLFSITKMNILLGRVLLTRDSLFYVNYFDKAYYSGGYDPIHEMLHFNLDFNTLQSIISANAFYLFKDEKELREFATWKDNGMYVLQSKAIRKLNRMEDKGRTVRAEKFARRLDEDIQVTETFYFDPELFVVRKLIVENNLSSDKAEFSFSDYEKVGEKFYPASVDMVYHSEKGSVSVFSKMAGFSTDSGEVIQLRIPEKYKKIYIN